MRKRTTRDTGMMEHEVDWYEGEEINEFFRIWRETMPRPKQGQHMGDAINEENERRMREIIKASGFSEVASQHGQIDLTPLVEKYIKEDHPAWIACQWINAYRRMLAYRDKFDTRAADGHDMASLIRYAKEMGIQEERMRWRAGVDNDTGKRREALAIGKRDQEKAIPKATQARRVQAQDTKPDWHDSATLDAHCIREKNPSFSRWRIAGILKERLEYPHSRGQIDKVLRANGIE